MNATKNYICINHGDLHACALEVANQFFFERNSNILLKKMNFYVRSQQKFKLLYDNIIIYCKLMTEAACNSKRISTVDSQKLELSGYQKIVPVIDSLSLQEIGLKQ